MSERLAIIGDVHGEADRLTGLLLQPECRERRAVFVGDLINRGTNSRRVLDIVRGLTSSVVVRGNHEQVLLDVLRGASITPLLVLGGAPTILDYVGIAEGDVAAQFRKVFPKDHHNLLRKSVRFFRHGELVVTHDGGRSVRPNAQASLQIGGVMPQIEPPPDEFWVFGHYPQASMKPLIGERFACIDTGAGGGGRVTAWLWPERTYIQS